MDLDAGIQRAYYARFVNGAPAQSKPRRLARVARPQVKSDDAPDLTGDERRLARVARPQVKSDDAPDLTGDERAAHHVHGS
jgi:hypothetical protein